MPLAYIENFGSWLALNPELPGERPVLIMGESGLRKFG